jgi:hypothetical protein
MRSSERQAVTRLRAVILVILALGVIAGFQPHGYMRAFVIAFNLPAAWTYVRPRWPLILIWIMWSVTWVMLAVIIGLGDRGPVLATWSHWLMAAATLILCVVLPLVRLTQGESRRPRARAGSIRIPEARVHVRD